MVAVMFVVGLTVGLVAGVAIGMVWRARHGPSAALDAQVVERAVRQLLDINRAQLEQAGAATSSALAANERLVESRLDQVRVELRDELARVGTLVGALQHTSQESFGQVSAQLSNHAASTRDLAHTTAQLREALASTKARGQWGERMASDVLRLAGMVEHVNYVQQRSLSEGSGIPDFTFLLPKGHKLFMDVKFPLANYLRYLDAPTDAERTAARRDFLGDVKLRVRELARRDYAAGSDSLRDVLLFIPNETISAFIHESDPSVFDEAMRQHIVLCSPLTLFAMLGVIRQAYDNFMVEERASEILAELGTFRRQWAKYLEQFDKVDRALTTVQRAWADLGGVRRNQLDRAIGRIEQVQQAGTGTGADPGGGLSEPDPTESMELEP